MLVIYQLVFVYLTLMEHNCGNKENESGHGNTKYCVCFTGGDVNIYSEQ